MIYFSATNLGDVNQTDERVTFNWRREEFGEQILTHGEIGWEAASRHAVWPPRLVAINFAFLPAPALFIII